MNEDLVNAFKSIGTGNISGNANSVQVFVGGIHHSGETVAIRVSLTDFRDILHDAEMYRAYGSEIKNKAKKWDRLHPAVQEVLEDCDGRPIQIIPS